MVIQLKMDLGDNTAEGLAHLHWGIHLMKFLMNSIMPNLFEISLSESSACDAKDQPSHESNKTISADK